MGLELHFKSISARWFTNVFSVSVAAVTVIASFISVFYGSFYVERVKTLADNYSESFSSLSSANYDTFEDTAFVLSDTFEHKTKLEIQVIDHEGRVLVSTTGFQSNDALGLDLEKAQNAVGKSYLFRGKNSDGEPILSRTTALYNADGEPLGAYRWVTSMKKSNRHITEVILLIIAVSLLLLGFLLLSGLYFIKSIVRPITEVSQTARKIAMGDFGAKLDINKNDEMGELCDTINYMSSELQQADTLKNDFISSVSHELRTPLTAIRGWGETAKMSVGVDDELVNRGLDVVLSETNRLSSLVEELLDFSRMQSGRLSVNVVPVDVSSLLNTAVDMYTELARQQGVEISYVPPVKASMVMGDPDRLKQVFINIIDNAVKYTEKGGLVLVVQNEEEGCVRIMVKDTGVGIPAQDIDRVKEKFFKSNKTVRGSGIGLAVADEIIKQHQGLLFLESTEGVGTTVTIVLPLSEETEPETTENILPPVDEIVAEDENEEVMDATVAEEARSAQNEANEAEKENTDG